MENYIVINGKKAELTQEQLKALGIVTEKPNPFARELCTGDVIYCISECGKLGVNYNTNSTYSDMIYAVANYCTDRNLMQQRAYHEILNRLLWRYSMEHDGDKIHLNHCWGLSYSKGVFEAYELYGHVFGECVFYSKEIANNAIKEIIKPFMEAHPDFKF